jgi:hypothetical protein
MTAIGRGSAFEPPMSLMIVDDYFSKLRELVCEGRLLNRLSECDVGARILRPTEDKRIGS